MAWVALATSVAILLVATAAASADLSIRDPHSSSLLHDLASSELQADQDTQALATEEHDTKVKNTNPVVRMAASVIDAQAAAEFVSKEKTLVAPRGARRVSLPAARAAFRSLQKQADLFKKTESAAKRDRARKLAGLAKAVALLRAHCKHSQLAQVKAQQRVKELNSRLEAIGEAQNLLQPHGAKYHAVVQLKAKQEAALAAAKDHLRKVKKKHGKLKRQQRWISVQERRVKVASKHEGKRATQRAVTLVNRLRLRLHWLRQALQRRQHEEREISSVVKHRAQEAKHRAERWTHKARRLEERVNRAMPDVPSANSLNRSMHVLHLQSSKLHALETVQKLQESRATNPVEKMLIFSHTYKKIDQGEQEMQHEKQVVLNEQHGREAVMQLRANAVKLRLKGQVESRSSRLYQAKAAPLDEDVLRYAKEKQRASELVAHKIKALNDLMPF